MEYTLKNGMILSVAPPVRADAADMVAYANRVGGESDNLTFGAGDFHMTVEQEEAFLDNIANTPASVMLLGRVDCEIASLCSLIASTRKRLAHNATLGITVRRDFWRQGVGEIMMRSAIEYAKAGGVIRIIHLSVRADNAGAIALYEKMGFRQVGRYDRETFVGGAYVDSILMDLFLSEM